MFLIMFKIVFLKELKIFIKMKFLINLYKTALSNASEYSKKEIVELLLKNPRIDPNVILVEII